ncbi:MAG TPA: 50S ribosomal protein L25 [Thermoanaerobaculia bacterium]|jgi:large subunit ribosomal protein L25|nr:50S ribosomal protein L25 [Thermoanaerobaculia bacterium]
MSEMSLQVDKREKTGKGGCRQARMRGQIPAVVYGSGKDSVPIQVNRKTFVEMMRKAGSENPILLLKLSDTGQERHAMIREMQRNPVSRQVIHIDFQRIEMTDKVRVTVPVELTGTAHGVKVEGGLIDFVVREVHIECLPGDIPKHLELDVTEMRAGQHAEAKDLKLPAGVTLLDEPERVIMSVVHARTEEVTAEAAAEPEVIKRGKAEA